VRPAKAGLFSRNQSCRAWIAGRRETDDLKPIDRPSWILDADIRSFFDRIDQTWLVRFLEHRVGDERVIRLVRKWLKAGVLDEGELKVSAEGMPQGAVVSPLLANVFLHYVFDLRAVQWRKREATGNIFLKTMAEYKAAMVCFSQAQLSDPVSATYRPIADIDLNNLASAKLPFTSRGEAA